MLAGLGRASGRHQIPKLSYLPIAKAFARDTDKPCQRNAGVSLSGDVLQAVQPVLQLSLKQFEACISHLHESMRYTQSILTRTLLSGTMYGSAFSP